jgi:MFS family permease
MLKELLGERAIAIVFALFFLTFLSMSTINVSLPLLTNERLGWTEREIGHVFGIFGLVMLVIQGGLMGRLTKRFGARRLVIAGALSSAVGLAAVALAHDTVPTVAGLAGLAIGIGLLTPCLSTLASEHAGAERQGTVLGFAQSSGGLARTVGPTLAGVAYAHIAPAAPFFGGAAAGLLSVVLGVVLLGLPPPPPEPERSSR